MDFEQTKREIFDGTDLVSKYGIEIEKPQKKVEQKVTRIGTKLKDILKSKTNNDAVPQINMSDLLAAFKFI